MPTLCVSYTDGKMREVVMYDPLRVRVNDCRQRAPGDAPFVAVNFADGQFTTKAYLPVALARELHAMLSRLFEDDLSPPSAESGVACAAPPAGGSLVEEVREMAVSSARKLAEQVKGGVV